MKWYKVVSLIENYRNHDGTVTTEITQFLKEWLAHHIKGEDQKMIDFFQSR